ncbi:hypothetical protein ACFWVT_23065, partial [Streptomyces cyaneofuscatus]
MTKKTRVRVARITAGAIIAAGASLTAAGAAQALNGHGEDQVTTQDGPADGGLIEGNTSGENPIGGADQGGASEGGDQGGASEGGDQGGASEGGDQGGASEGGDQGGASEGGDQGGASEGGDQGGASEG